MATITPAALQITNPDQWQALRACMSADQLAQLDACVTLAPEPLEDEADDEPRYSVAESRFVHGYDTLPLSCAMLKRYGPVTACLLALIEKYSARGDKEFYGGQPLLEVLAGLDRRAYEARAVLIADGLLTETDGPSYDRRKRLSLDKHAKHALALEWAASVMPKCAEHKNWRGLVDRLVHYPISDDDSQCLPSGETVLMENPIKGKPSGENVHMHMYKSAISEVNGCKEVYKPNPPRARASDLEPAPIGHAVSREPGSDDEETATSEPAATASDNAAEMLVPFCETNGVKHKHAVVMLHCQGQRITPAEAAQAIANAHKYNADHPDDTIKSWKWFETEFVRIRDTRGKTGQTPIGGHVDWATPARIKRELESVDARIRADKQNPDKVAAAETHLSAALAAAHAARDRARLR